MAHYDYLIVGGGMTADAAAHGIRERDGIGSIGIISGEHDAPYNRPPLSKALWKGDAVETIWRKTGETRAALHLGIRAHSIDTAAKRVVCDDGSTHEFRKLLLATGGAPRTLPNAPAGVIYYRTLADYRRTRELADRGARFIVVGGGFIGAEVAAALRMQGRDVTIIMPDDGICARILPKDLSAFVTNYYREKGVTVKTGDSVERIESRGAEYVVHTKNAGALVADAVIAGIGITPEVSLAQQAGLSVDNGIIVDEQLRTNNPDIHAAGDVANFFSTALGNRTRVEHEDNANTMGAMAGRNMAGAAEKYEHIPFFYSDLFDLGYEAVGDLDARLETRAEWKEPFREGVIHYMKDGRVRGVLLWNTWGQVDAARALITGGETKPS